MEIRTGQTSPYTNYPPERTIHLGKASRSALKDTPSDSFVPTIRFGHKPSPEQDKIWRFNENEQLVPVLPSLDELSSEVKEYWQQNFGHDEILAEDREIIENLITTFTTGGLFQKVKKTFEKDIQSGEELRLANLSHDLYSAQLLNGLANTLETKNYTIDLIDPLRISREAVHQVLHGKNTKNAPFQHSMWDKFRDFMQAKGGNVWNGGFNAVREHGRVIQGDMLNLPKARYHAAFSFFSVNLAKNSIQEFEEAVQSYVNSVKKGGLVAGALLNGSTGWKMGQYWIPSVPLTRETVEKAFKKAGVNITITKTETPPEIRNGYDGMLIYSGIKTR